MNLTNYERVRKLINNLISNPGLVHLYIKHNVFSKRSPIDLGLPWWSYNAIEYVNGIVEGKSIFEYGTGGSTILFSKKAKNIVAVEDNSKWLDVVKMRLKKLQIRNVEVIYSPFDFLNPDHFECSDYLKMVDKSNFDIIIIDGQDWSFQERVKCFRYVEPRMTSGQFIIVDDFWRYPQLIKSNKAKDLKVFESVGPGRLGVTSTAVFAY